MIATLMGCLASLSAQNQQKNQPNQPKTYGQPKNSMTTTAQPSTEFEQRFEAKLGKPLTADQKQRIAKALQTYATSTRTPHIKFIQDLARGLNQTEDVIAPLVPLGTSPTESLDKIIAPKLEGKLARKLTPAETQRIKTLDDGRKALLKTLQDNYAKQLAAITGLPLAAVTEIISK